MNENFAGYKKCPYCGKFILKDAIYCKHCNKSLTTTQTTKNDDKTQDPNEKHNTVTQSIDYKIGRICIVIVFLLITYSSLGDEWFKLSHLFPHISSIEQKISLPGGYVQTDLQPPLQFQINSGKNFRILMAQAQYSLTGMVIAQNTNFWLRGIMQNDFDKVVPIDLGIVWGELANEQYLKKHFRFKSQKTLGEARQLNWHWDRTVTESGEFINRHISHNHIIPANDNITSILLKVKKWDLIKLDGYLVDIIYSNGMTSYTSLSRRDTNPTSRGAHRNDGSGGACEIFYVTGVQIGTKYYK